MSTKLEIIELINTNLADDSEILASEHRDVEKALVNELFPDIFSEKDVFCCNLRTLLLLIYFVFR